MKSGNHETETASIFLRLMDVRQMFERAKVKEPNATAEDIPEPWDGKPKDAFHFTNDPWGNVFVADPNETSDYIILVHGWRMNYDEAQTWAETSYKRLWQLGYKGRFAFFSWPTYGSGSWFDFSGLPAF